MTNLYFWLAVSFGLYLAVAILWSVVLEVSLKKDLREKNIDTFEVLASVAIWLTYGALFWPLSVAKTLVYVIRKKIERRKIDKKLKKTLEEMAKEQTKPLGQSIGEPIIDEVKLTNKVNNGGFKATQSWGGNEPMITEPAWISQIPRQERLFYRGLPIVEHLEKILATQDMKALQDLIDELKKVGG